VNKKFGDEAHSIPTSHTTPKDTGMAIPLEAVQDQHSGEQPTNPSKASFLNALLYDCPSPRLGLRIGARDACLMTLHDVRITDYCTDQLSGPFVFTVMCSLREQHPRHLCK
jgi:hypothetical protein